MTRPGATLGVGPVLGESILLVLRHWVILVVALFVMAEGSLLTFSILGRCFDGYTNSCPSFMLRFGNTEQYTFKAVVEETAGYVVTSVASYFLYTSAARSISEVATLRGSTARALHFFGRLALLWLIIVTPVLAFDFALSKAIEAFPSITGSAAAKWLGYILRTAIIVLFASYVHARLALYLPSAAFAPTPENWLNSWRSTRGHALRLFTVFMLMGSVASAANLGLLILFYKAPGFFDLVDFVSNVLGVRSNYVMRHLPQTAVSDFVGVPLTLLEAAVSLVAFRKLMPVAEQSTASIFD